MSGLFAIFEKELTENLRDVRSMMVLIAFTSLGPLAFAGTQALMEDKIRGQDELKIILEGDAHAPELVERLRRRDIVASDDAEIRVIVPEDFAAVMARGETVRIPVIADRSKLGSRGPTQRIERAIDAYGQELGALRMLLRGVPLSVARPIVAEPKNSAPPEARGAFLMGFMAVYFLFSAFVGSMGVAADSAAGERERSSLEVLLAQPVSPQVVFAGKWLCATLFSILSVLFTIGVSRLVFTLVPLEGTGISWSLGLWGVVTVVGLLLPLAGFAAALQLCVSFWAKTYKAATMSLNMLNLIPMMVAFGIMLQELEPETWMFAVPVLGHQQMLVAMVRGEILPALQAWLLVGGTSVLTALLIGIGTFMLTREKIVFGH